MVRCLSSFAVAFSLLVGATPLLSCNGNSVGADDGGTGGDGGGGGCDNLRCQVVDCAAQGKSSTTLTGIVNIPAGNLPLYNATVYVPNRAVAPIQTGASCDRCSDLTSGDPVTLTHTDAMGRFTLKDVPVGSNIPLVIRLGKWRRQLTVSTVSECTENPVDPLLTRLPRNQSEGDIPKIALSTGGYDAAECLLRKIGIDDAEFTPETGTGRINLFAGHGGTNAYCTAGTGSCTKTLNGGAAFTSSTTWWSSLDNLKQYDIVVLSCEGGLYTSEKSTQAHQALFDYLNMGGRVFASHWHNIWISAAPKPMSDIATFSTVANGVEYNSPINASIYTNFAKGNALADWMVNVQGSSQRGTFQILKGRATVLSIPDTTRTERFVYYNDTSSGKLAEQYFSFYMPLNLQKDQQCGRMVFTDMHISGNDVNSLDPSLDLSSPTKPFPSGCISTSLLAQEKALLFLLFDLTNCVEPPIG